MLWQRLHDRAQAGRSVRLIVHLKNGATYVGVLVFYDLTGLTISTHGRQHEFWVHDLAHILAVPEGMGFPAPLPPTNPPQRMTAGKQQRGDD